MYPRLHTQLNLDFVPIQRPAELQSEASHTVPDTEEEDTQKGAEN